MIDENYFLLVVCLLGVSEHPGTTGMFYRHLEVILVFWNLRSSDFPTFPTPRKILVAELEKDEFWYDILR